MMHIIAPKLKTSMVAFSHLQLGKYFINTNEPLSILKSLRRENEKKSKDNNEDENETNVSEKNDVHLNKNVQELGGPLGPEPTRYGDWERKGKTSDF